LRSRELQVRGCPGKISIIRDYLRPTVRAGQTSMANARCMRAAQVQARGWASLRHRPSSRSWWTVFLLPSRSIGSRQAPRHWHAWSHSRHGMWPANGSMRHGTPRRSDFRGPKGWVIDGW